MNYSNFQLILEYFLPLGFNLLNEAILTKFRSPNFYVDGFCGGLDSVDGHTWWLTNRLNHWNMFVPLS
jgi:hypothetical protein